jgi:alkaline phosphatase D
MADYVNLVLRKFPLALVWDDHDYGMNNGDKTYANKALSLQVLQEMFPTYPVSAYGDWQFFSYGQADFIMLDRLSQSDPYREPDGPDKSYLDGDNLGSAGQLQWLLNRLKYSKAKWKFVITPTIFNPTPGKPDSWAGYLTERQSILSFITANQIKNVILISADIHFGAIDNGTNSGLPELLVPPVNVQGCVTNPGNNQYQGTWSEGIYGTWIRGTPCWGFAYVEVKSTSNPNTVHLFVKDSDNNTKVSYTVTAQ